MQPDVVVQMRETFLGDLQNYCGAGLEKVGSVCDCSVANGSVTRYVTLLIGMKGGSNADLSRFDMSLFSAWEEFDGLAKDTSLRVSCKSHRKNDLWACQVDLPKSILEGIGKSQLEVRGLCLECELDGKPLVEASCTHYGITQPSENDA